MWERFSYYGMRSLLVLYLCQRVFADDNWRRVAGASTACALYGAPPPLGTVSAAVRERHVVRLASRIYGSYTALVYLTPLGGGLLADRVLGARRCVLLGGAVMAAGHAAMTSEVLTFLGLLLIALGCGLFKPNISTQVGCTRRAARPRRRPARAYSPTRRCWPTQVGRLYAGDATPTRRDAAFSAFYVGINVGAALAPLVTGALAHSASFGAGFAAAGVGMGVGLAVMLLGARHLPPDAPHLQPAAADAAAAPSRPSLRALLSRHRRRVAALLVLAALNVPFWAVYEQQGDALALFIEDRVARGGMPSAFFQSLNPAFILLFTPAVNAAWRAQARRDREPHAVAKMAIGAALLAASFLILALGTAAARGGKTPAVWVVLHLAVLTLGELYLSPVGLSFVTQVAPAELAALLMGCWFLSSFFGNYLAGALGALYADAPPARFWAGCATLAGADAMALIAAWPRLMSALAAPPRGD